MQKTAQTFYDMTYQLKIYGDYQVTKLPTGRDLVETLVAHLPLNNPIVEVIPFKDTAVYREKAVKQQDFFQAMLQHSMQQSDPALLYAAKDIGLRGEAFLKGVYDEGVMSAMPERKKGESDEDYADRKQAYLINRMPLILTCPDPQNCYPSRDHIDCHPVEMIEVYPTYAGIVKALFPKWKTAKKGNDIVIMVEYWNPEKFCYLADGTPATEGDNGFEDNIYGLTPYTHVYSGMGARDVDNTPESKAVNIIFEAQELIKQQCRLYGYMDKATAFAATPIISTDKEQADYEGVGLKVTPGMVLYGGEKVSVDWAAANLPAGILQAIMMNESRINRIQPGVLRGQAPSGVEHGYPMALMIGEARLEFGTALENLKVLFARALDQMRVLIRDVAEEDIPIWGKDNALTLSKKDCEGAFRTKVEFDSSTPESRAERALTGQRLRQGGSISLYTELKVWQGNKNPEKEINRIMAESILKHPAVQRPIAVEAVREIKGEQVAMLVEQAMTEGEAGAVRKAGSTGIPMGGRPEAEMPEDVLAGALTKRGKARRGEPTEGS